MESIPSSSEPSLRVSPTSRTTRRPNEPQAWRHGQNGRIRPESRMRPSLRSALANVALVLVSLAVTYLIASFVIFRFVLPHLSLNLHPHFPDIAELFAQTSKAGTVPRDYIALLGDSYAEGQGDGLIAAGGDRARVVHSAPPRPRFTTSRRERAGDGAPARAH